MPGRSLTPFYQITRRQDFSIGNKLYTQSSFLEPKLFVKFGILVVFVIRSLGIAGVRNENGGVGRAKPAQHHHIFPHILAVPREPRDMDTCWGNIVSEKIGFCYPGKYLTRVGNLL